MPFFVTNVQRINKAFWRKSYLLLALAFFLTQCTYRTPGTETPAPSERTVEKSFFVGDDGKPKTFLCGWASETEVGWMGEGSVEHNIPMTQHCNVQFQITEETLTAKLVNPSFPNDPAHWQNILSIPIVSHYYLEADKDSHGRDTNRVIENSSRSHWSARPYMKLDLQNVNISKRDFGGDVLTGATGLKYSLDDVEWDRENNFLAFSIETTDPLAGSDLQTKLRYNFLKFDHNDSFQKTPFNDKNYRYMNVLHIMGEKVNGIYPILYAAHWDLSKQHEIILNNFPDNYRAIAEGVIADWNQTFQKIGAVAPGIEPFKAVTKNLKHPFDLRYSSINWVDDVRIAAAGGGILGVGEAIADVTDGELKWAGITLYGGLIENYIKAYLPTSTSSDSASASKNALARLMLDAKLIPQALTFPTTVTIASGSGASDQVLNQILTQLQTMKNNAPATAAAPQITGGIPQAASARIAADMQQFTKRQAGLTGQYFASQNFRNLLGQKVFKLDTITEATEKTTPQDDAQIRLDSNVFDRERTIDEVGPLWSQAMASGKYDYPKVVDSVVTELITHEYGHIMGLGHQFKENILPKKGTVPDSIYEGLKAKATADKEFTNMTSVMGYRSPRAEVASHAEDIKPGPQDELVLSFLYNRKYATYKTGDNSFSFVDLPASGIIPAADPARADYKTSYFPQCNDIEASLALDPYCNRFDQGNSATEIVNNYFKDLNDNLISRLNAFTDTRGGNADAAEWGLWRHSMETLGRVRLFYDYMRTKYEPEINSIRNDESALYEFSRACTEGSGDSAAVNQIFSANPELVELCKANKIVLEEIKNMVSLSTRDYTKVDITQAYVPGGMSGGDDGTRDWSHVLGTWSELGGLPLKISALYALTSPRPWVSQFWQTVPNYESRDADFAYYSLYPREYTQAITAAASRNLDFASLDNNNKNSQMGSAAFSLSYFAGLANQSNDAGRFPKHYIEQIRAQSQFNFAMVAVILTAKQKEKGGPNRYDHFDAQVFDMVTNKTQKATYAYLLPDGQVIVRAENMLLLPVTKLQLYADDEGYVIAYRLDYYKERDDLLSEESIKRKLLELNDMILSTCVDGPSGSMNGLSHYFKSDFDGFYMAKGVASNEEQHNLFLDSIKESFANYYASPQFKTSPRPETCMQALRDLGLITSESALLNGYWVPGTEDYVQK